jgi:hypothetical protein
MFGDTFLNQAASLMPDLHNRVLTWLQGHGAPLELRSARVLRTAGWNVEHAHYYADPATQKPRELDLLADRTWRGQKATFTFALAIDCKQSHEKPWIVFSAAPNSGFRSLAMMFAAGNLSETILLNTIGFDDNPPIPFRVGARLGHGVVKAFGDAKEADPSGPYAALQSVVAAAAAVDLRSERLAGLVGTSYSEGTIVLPVLVVDAPLYEYYADAEGTEHLSEIQEIIALAPKPTHAGSTVNVTVVRANHLDRFAVEVMQSVESFAPLALEAIPVVAAEARERAQRTQS